MMGAAGSICRKIALLAVGYLVQYGFLKSDELAEQAAAVFTALLYALLEYGLFIYRTRNGKAQQRALDPRGLILKHDGISEGDKTTRAIVRMATAPNH